MHFLPTWHWNWAPARSSSSQGNLCHQQGILSCFRFFFSRCMSSRCPHWKNKLLQWTCQARLQPGSTQRGKAGRESRQQRYETNTVIMCKDHPKVWDKVSNYWRSYCTMQQSNRLFNQLDHFQYFQWSSSSCRNGCTSQLVAFALFLWIDKADFCCKWTSQRASFKYFPLTSFNEFPFFYS